MSEYVDNHPLGRDFPEFKEAIHTLKMNDRHFKRLLDEYENVDREVVRAEQGVEYLADLELEEKKKVRLHLKDQFTHVGINEGEIAVGIDAAKYCSEQPDQDASSQSWAVTPFAISWSEFTFFLHSHQHADDGHRDTEPHPDVLSGLQFCDLVVIASEEKREAQ